MEFIYILFGVMFGIIIGTVIKFPAKIEKQISQSIGGDLPQGIVKEQTEEKEKNLAKIRQYISGKDKITNNDIETLLNISNSTAARYLDELENENIIKQVGNTGKYTYYQKV